MLEKLTQELQRGGETAPFLLVYSESKEIFYEKFFRELKSLCNQFWVDNYSIHQLAYNDENSHKIQYVKEFIELSYSSARQAFQVFVLEDFWRLTVAAQNACLKFFEEPGKGNIIIATAPHLQTIADTILSRVQIVKLWCGQMYQKNIFFENIILKALQGEKELLLSYFFPKKYEKEEYLDFLKTLLYILIEQQIHLHIHQSLHDDISGIESNNFLARYIVDRYVLEL